MATIEAVYSRVLERVRDYRRTAGDVLGAAGLWLLIAAFVVWSFLAERDALVTGVVTGSVFALGAIGLTLIYGVLKFGHFAHGDGMMLSAYLAFLLLSGTIIGTREDTELLPVHASDLPGAETPIWDFSFGYGLLIAMLLAAAITAALLVGLDRLIYRPLRRRGSGIVIYSIASLGVALVMRSLMFIFWGAGGRFYTRGFRSAVELPFDIRVLNDQLFIFGAACLLAGMVYLLLYRTKLGKAMRAMADNAELARISGINTEQVVVWTWVIAGVLLAVSGVMLALQAQLDPQLGFIVLLPLFAAAILGGIGSPQGALVGGLVVGMVQEVAVTLNLDFIREGFPGPGYKFAIAFIVLVIILLVRPRGLFGARV